MEKIVYLIGAGFSAPLGLPVMKNFISKSKDLFSQDPIKYKNLMAMFNQLSKLNKIKSYFQSDLLNIEEVLSILDMKDQILHRKTKKDFIEYICNVIESYSPDLNIINKHPLNDNFFHTLFGNNETFQFYGNFVLSLHNLSVIVKTDVKRETGSTTYNPIYFKNPKAKYLIVSLNYDDVLENFMNIFCDRLNLPKNKYIFNKLLDANISPPNLFDQITYLAKIHGSIDKKDIIPPSWSKNISKSILEGWQIAYFGLSEATQIRILGYSLPICDSYIKYLLKASILNSFNLKKIDIICLDQNDEVHTRYNEFIDFCDYRFKNINVLAYLNSIYAKKSISSASKLENIFNFSQIEEVHDNFMNN